MLETMYVLFSVSFAVSGEFSNMASIVLPYYKSGANDFFSVFKKERKLVKMFFQKSLLCIVYIVYNGFVKC